MTDFACLCCGRSGPGHRYACHHCTNDMRRWLVELEDYVAIVLAMRGSIGSKPHGSVGTAFKSKPPMPLDSVAMLDSRSAAPDSEGIPVSLLLVIADVVFARDGHRCTWLSGYRRGGGFAYLADDYDPARRCVAVATAVGHIANQDETDPANLRSLCTPHFAYDQRRVAVGSFDPAGWDIHDNVRSLTGGIHGIACWIREERGDSEPAEWTLVSELRYLRTQIESCAFEQWVDELHSDLKELHSQARSLAQDSPRPLAHCLSGDCEGMVFWVIKEEGGKRVDEAKCASCHRRYSGTDLVRLGAAEEVAG